MTPERWYQVEELYHRALELPESERDGFLDEACCGDVALRREVESLLARSGRDDSFVERIVDAGQSWIGRQVGPYHMQALLGAGGMGEVYRARDTRLKRDVAVKVLPARLTQDRDHLARFRREAQVLASLNHPNIATIHGLEEADGTPCVVMELVPGETLAGRLKRGRLSINEALPIAIQIAEAVEAAHDKGIIHRDLKPANIKLTPQGKVKVLDFGLAKAFPAARSDNTDLVTGGLTVEGMIVGTPAYMSPEQVRGKTLDKGTDIWAFGCVLFEMISGHQAFRGETFSDITAAILTVQPDWRSLTETTPTIVRRLLERCLQKDPATRLHDAAEARIELDEAIRSVQRRPGLYRWRKFASVSIAGLIIITITVVALLILRRGTASRRADATAGVVTSQLTNYGDETAAAISPDGRSFVFISSHGGTSDIWLRQVSGGEPVRLTNDAAQETDVAYASDGETIYFSRRDTDGESIWQIGVLGGQPRKAIPNAHSPAPSPDGLRIAYLSPETTGATETLIVSAFDGSDKRSVAQRVPNFPRVRAAWSRDGRWLSYVRGGLLMPINLYVVEFATGRERQVTRFDRAASGIGQHAWLPDNRHLAVSYLPYSRTQVAYDLGVLDVEDGSISRLTALTSTANDGLISPTVSIDGSRLIATSTRLVREVWKVPLQSNDPDGNGRGAVRLIASSKDPWWTFVTRDMRTLLYNSTANGSRNLWMAQLDRIEEARQITSIPNDAISHSSLSPDGTQVAFVSIAKGHADVWIQNVDGSNLQQLTNDDAADAWPVWSPDGRSIVFSSARNGIHETWIVPSGGGAGRKLIDGFFRGDWIRKPSGEGTWMVTSDSVRNVRLIDVERQTVIWDKAVGPTPFSLPVFSPDGRTVSVPFQESGDRDAIQLLDAATGEGRVVARLPFQVRFRASWIDKGKALLVNSNPTVSHTVLFDNFWKP